MMGDINKPEKDPKELFDHNKIMSFLRDSKSDEFIDLRDRIINKDVRIGNDKLFFVSSKDIRDFVVEIRHKLRKIKDEKNEEKKEEAFDMAYKEVVSGDAKFIKGFKKLTGYLLHIFDEEKVENITYDVNVSLKNMLGLDRKRIFNEFSYLVKSQKPEEIGTNLLGKQVEAFEEIKNRNNGFDVIEDKENLFDCFVRKYNDSQENRNKKRSQ